MRLIDKKIVLTITLQVAKKALFSKFFNKYEQISVFQNLQRKI